MSRMKFRWLSGEKDPYVGNLEMKPQKEYIEEEASLRERMRENQMVMDKVYDTRHNKWLFLFRRFYRIMAVVFCAMLAGLLQRGILKAVCRKPGLSISLPV